MTKGSDKIDMDSFDDSVYKDCTPLFSETLPFGEHYMPVLQGLENPEKHVYFDTPNLSLANLPDQSEGDLSIEGQGQKGCIFPVWEPLQLEENAILPPQDMNGEELNVILPTQDPWEDNGFHIDEQIPQEGVHLVENVILPPQDPWEDINGIQVDDQIPQGGVHLVKEVEGPNGLTDMIHQELDQPLAYTIVTNCDHHVVDDIPPGPSHASEGQVANLQPRRRRGRPRKLPSPAPQSIFEITRRPRTKRTRDKIMKGAWSKLVSPNGGWLNAVPNHHFVASEAPKEANLPLKRGRGRPQKLTSSAPQKIFEITRRPRTKRTEDKILKGAWSRVASQNGGWLNAVQNHHSVASEAPEEANLPLKRGRGRPCKLAPPNKRPEKRPEFVLPAGWTIKVVVRKNGKSAGRKDMFYIEDATGHQCRSQVEVTRYLELKATQQ